MRGTLHVEFDDSADELRAFLKALRSWDRGRSEVSMSIAFNLGTMTAGEFKAILAELDPPLPVIVESSGVNRG
jgi:hypothetical protein